MRIKRLYQQLKNIYHYFQSHGWRIWYERPERALTFYGVTGTNGKTTASYLLDSVLAEAYGRKKVGMLTTVAFRIGEREEINETKMTTLPSRLVWKYLADMKQAGVKYVVLEMTSHALDQHRLAGVRLAGAIWLNLQREHLDYHQTMEAYAAAKAKIVDYLLEDAPLVAKQDDERVWKAVRGRVLGERLIGFTAEEARGVQVGLSGEMNQENALAVQKLAQAVGIADEVITKGLLAVTHVPGRMEWIETDTGFRVLIDYALTPDALERLYQGVREKTSGRVLALLGAAGLRDRGKRPDMARVVAQYADVLVITREDPWTEPEEQIFTDLEEGLPASAPHPNPLPASGERGTSVMWKRIVDRREALQWLLDQAQVGDVVVVTGKGAERGMGIGKEVIPWNDREVIEEILQEQSLRGAGAPKQSQ